METQNYRGVRIAHVISVKEGNGTPENPSKIVEYVLLPKENGMLVSVGILVPLTLEQRQWIGNDAK